MLWHGSGRVPKLTARLLLLRTSLLVGMFLISGIQEVQVNGIREFVVAQISMF